MSERLFSAIFVPEDAREAVSDRAWLQAMLDAEAGLAAAQARTGVIPQEAATAIGACCRAERFDPEALGREARRSATPVEPLTRALAAEVGGEAAGFVHWGATSQDVMDTAAMLVARRALELILADLDALADACAGLAQRHRATLMIGRTLLQHAAPTTFGLKAAGWLAGVLDARDRLTAVRDRDLAVQLGGAVGTLAALGDEGPAVRAAFAAHLGLPCPPLPWHTVRNRVGGLASALAVAAGAAENLGNDLTLLSQTEVAEVVNPSLAGASSAMVHKRNPVGPTLAAACAAHVRSSAGVLLGAMAQEHERAAGAWQAEWTALGEALAMTAGAVSAVRQSVEGLEVRADRMRENVDLTGGLVLGERLVMLLAPHLGRPGARALLQRLVARVDAEGLALRDALLADATVCEHLSPEDIDAALDPSRFLGAAGTFIDAALDLHRRKASP